MSDEQKTEETAPEIEAPKYVFPNLDKGPAAFYDDEARVAWLGIPFDKVNDPSFVLASVDRCKFDFLNYLGKYMMDNMRLKALTDKTKIEPSILDRLGLGRKRTAVH